MYRIRSDKYVVRLSDEAVIPADPMNSDYLEYQAWLAEGNEPLPVEPSPPQPQRMSSLTFLELFAEDELVAIATAAMQDVQAKLWYDRTLAAEYVTIEDPRTAYGLQALVSMELLTAERAEEIKARMYA